MVVRTKPMFHARSAMINGSNCTVIGKRDA